MKLQTVSGLFLVSVFLRTTYGQAVVGPDCWNDGKCNFEGKYESKSTITATDMADAAEQCYDLCNGDDDCNFFTVNSFRKIYTCYLLATCDENNEDFCLTQGSCISGPTDCSVETPLKDCPAILETNTVAGKIHWQCTDKDGNPVNGYDDTATIKPETTCILRCESWEDKSGNDGYLKSTCQDDGNWSPTTASDDNADGLAFPAKPDGGEYVKPDGISEYACGCQPLDVMWPTDNSETPWYYDPNFEEGADFVCDTPIEAHDGSGTYIIETGNVCILFCDSHLVATVQCVNGEWTGEPELGLWCYTEPQKADELTTTPSP